MLQLTTRRVYREGFRPRVLVSNGQGTTATFAWDDSATAQDNHLAAAVTFAREMFGFTPAVVSNVTTRTSADGYNVTLSRYTEEA